MPGAASASCETYLAHLRLGNETREGSACRVVRNDGAPSIFDSNHLQIGPADTAVDPDRALGFLEDELGHLAHRQIYATSFLPPAIEARLHLEDYAPEATLQGLLVGRLSGPAPRACDIRPVASADDWAALDRLVRLDHVETNERIGREQLTESVTTQMQSVRRAAAGDVQFFLAYEDDVPVAFFSAWAGPGTPESRGDGVGRVGMVEDLFTHPDHRGRGIARALIHHCVTDARARGADAVLIGAESDDTPKKIYAAMGFEPTCVTHAWRPRARD